MLANNVQESTTTTGTVPIILDGSSKNGRTVSSVFAVNARLSYYIDDLLGDFEHGVGYLSDATTLVRETIIDSTNAGLTVNFSAGVKQVFVNQSAQIGPFTRLINASGINQSSGWYLSSHIPYDSVVDATSISPNRVFLVPLYWSGGSIADMGTQFSGTINSSTKFRLGIYEMNYDFNPGALLAETSDITPVTGSFVSASLQTAVMLRRGWYWTAYLDDGGARLRAQNGSVVSCTPLGMRGGTTVMNYASDSIPSGWVSLPTALTINEEQHINPIPRIVVRA